MRRATAVGPEAAAGGRAVLVVLAATLLARAVAGFSASGWLWGLNTFRDWPPPGPVALPALAALAFVPAARRRAGALLDAGGDRLARAGLPGQALLAALVGLAVFALRDPVRFTGDSLTRLKLAASVADIGAITPQMGLLDRLVNVEAVRWLMGRGVPGADALQAVGALTAAAFTLCALAFLRALELRGRGWIAAATLVLGGGSLVHMAGYSKQGPLLVGLALAGAGLVRLAREGRGAWTLATGAVVALAAHRAGYAVLPAIAWAYAAALRGAAPRRRARIACAAAAVAAVALALLPHDLRVLLDYDRRVNFSRASAAGPVRRLADVLNALFLLSPVWPVALPAAWAARRAAGEPAPAPRAGKGSRSAEPRRSLFSFLPVAGLALAGELALMLLVRGRQGYLRDWDNQLGPALVVTLLTAGLLAAAWRRPGGAGAALPVTAVALVSGLALWGLHASPPIAEARVRTLLADASAWTSEEWGLAHDFVGQRAYEAGRYEEAARAYEIAGARVPTPRILDNLAICYGMAGRREEARLALGRAMAAPQQSVTMWVALGRLADLLGDSVRARACMDSARAGLEALGPARPVGPGTPATATGTAPPPSPAGRGPSNGPPADGGPPHKVR